MSHLVQSMARPELNERAIASACDGSEGRHTSLQNQQKMLKTEEVSLFGRN